MHKVGGCLRLVIALLCGLKVFLTCTCLQESEALAEGLGLLGGRVTRCFCVVELLARYGVAAHKCVHSLEVDLRVRCIGSSCGVVSLGLAQLL